MLPSSHQGPQIRLKMSRTPAEEAGNLRFKSGQKNQLQHSCSQSDPVVVDDINAALRDLDRVDQLHCIELSLGDGLLLRDEPAFDELLFHPSTCRCHKPQDTQL
jgi:hypothetical protein